MAKRDSTAVKPVPTREERQLLTMYRQMSRWEKNAFFLITQSAAWGGLTEQSDSYSWKKMRRTLGLRKESRHG